MKKTLESVITIINKFEATNSYKHYAILSVLNNIDNSFIEKPFDLLGYSLSKFRFPESNTFFKNLTPSELNQFSEALIKYGAPKDIARILPATSPNLSKDNIDKFVKLTENKKQQTLESTMDIILNKFNYDMVSKKDLQPYLDKFIGEPFNLIYSLENNFPSPDYFYNNATPEQLDNFANSAIKYAQPVTFLLGDIIESMNSNLPDSTIKKLIEAVFERSKSQFFYELYLQLKKINPEYLQFDKLLEIATKSCNPHTIYLFLENSYKNKLISNSNEKDVPLDKFIKDYFSSFLNQISQDKDKLLTYCINALRYCCYSNNKKNYRYFY